MKQNVEICCFITNFFIFMCIFCCILNKKIDGLENCRVIKEAHYFLL
jgi:hypothetical protein